MTLTEMLESNSIPEPNSGCWIWLGGLSNGYAAAWWEGRSRRASHLALLSKGIEIPPKLKVCHRCDNTLCINDDHLFVGTDTDNRRDAKAKGRLRNMKREFCKAGHPLTGDNVRVWHGQRRCVTCHRRWSTEGARRRRARHG
jgi:hypothetical protein